MSIRLAVVAGFLSLTILVSAGPTNSISKDEVDFIASQARSALRSNFFVVIFTNNWTHPHGTPTIQETINYGFIDTDTANHPYNILMLMPEYGYRIAATSESEQPVAKTRKGAKYGEKFDAIKHWDRDRRKLDMTRHSGYPRENPYWTLSGGPSVPPMRKFPALEELFRFDKPGKYAVSIEFQFVTYPVRTHATNACLVRLPPVNFMVVNSE